MKQATPEPVAPPPVSPQELPVPSPRSSFVPVPSPLRDPKVGVSFESNSAEIQQVVFSTIDWDRWPDIGPGVGATPPALVPRANSPERSSGLPAIGHQPLLTPCPQ